MPWRADTVITRKVYTWREDRSESDLSESDDETMSEVATVDPITSERSEAAGRKCDSDVVRLGQGKPQLQNQSDDRSPPDVVASDRMVCDERSCSTTRSRDNRSAPPRLMSDTGNTTLRASGHRGAGRNKSRESSGTLVASGRVQKGSATAGRRKPSCQKVSRLAHACLGHDGRVLGASSS